MSQQSPPDPPKQNINIDDSLVDKSPIAIAGDDLVQIQGSRNKVFKFVFNFFRKQESSRQDFHRQKLLKKVKEEVQERLRQSLYNNFQTQHNTSINLYKEKHPDQVQPHKSDQVKVGSKSGRGISPERNIVEIFDEDAGSKLLILGAPGAGKTTAMLNIATELIARAENDDKQPIPVLFNLSAWKKDRDIDSWLLEQFKIYHVSKKIGKKWLENCQIIPLIDELDEIEATRQEKCVEAINNFLESNKRPPGMVICSRDKEYKLYETKLRLNEAVFLKPLDKLQISKYLIKLEFSEIWDIIKNNFELLKLAHTPFFLGIIIFLDKEVLLKKWLELNSKEKQVQYLFNQFIAQMLARPIRDTYKGKQPKPEHIKKRLIWLAKILEKNNDKEFLIESIQPSLLQSPWQKWLYRVGVWIITFALGGMFLWIFSLGIIIKLFSLNIYKLSNTIHIAISSGILFGIIGLIYGVMGTLKGKLIGRKVSALVLAIIGMVYFITLSRVWSDRNVLLIFNSQIPQFLNIFFGLFAGIFIGLSSSIVGGLFGLYMGIGLSTTTAIIGKLLGSSSREPRQKIRLVETFSGIKWKFRIAKTTTRTLSVSQRSVRDKLTWFIFCLTCFGVMYGIFLGAREFNQGIIFGFFFWAFVEVSAQIDRLIASRYGVNQEIIIRWYKFIQVIIYALVFCIVGVKLILSQAGGNVIGIIGLVVCVLVPIIELREHKRLIRIKLYSPLRNTILLSLIKPSLNERIEANQGIWKSAFNAIIYALIVTVVVGLITPLFFNITIGDFIVGLLILGLPSGFIAGYFLGGRAVIQHFVLRVILWCSGSIPWNYAQFLEYTTERMLMQTVGGRYQFIHNLLQKHFAAM